MTPASSWLGSQSVSKEKNSTPNGATGLEQIGIEAVKTRGAVGIAEIERAALGGVRIDVVVVREASGVFRLAEDRKCMRPSARFKGPGANQGCRRGGEQARRGDENDKTHSWGLARAELKQLTHEMAPCPRSLDCCRNHNDALLHRNNKENRGWQSSAVRLRPSRGRFHTA